MLHLSHNVKTRRIKRSSKEWVAHRYQARATDFLLEHGAAALFADPGLGKTSIALNALTHLFDEGVASKALVIAPKRVCELVWWQESQKWSQFRHLRFAWLHSSRAPWDIDGSPKKKDEELRRDADVYVINPEGILWLHNKFFGRQLPFDTVIIDELTKFKKSTAKRSKMLRKMTTKTPRMWGLTGTPAPNGYEDLFGQMLLLDGGAALGHTFTQFRDKYMVPDGFSGFQYKLAKGAEKLIEKRIAPLCLRMSAEDYLDLPPLVDDVREIKLDDKSRKTYEKMKKDMLLQVENGEVTAANAAALYSKLSQMANGAVYLDEDPLSGDKRGVAHIHDAKLDALEELVEELSGQPLLVGYEFKHDLARLQKRFPDAPYIGSGVGARETQEIERAWNANEIPVLFAHPASTGHGLNLQEGSASHVCWFSASWDYELYDQFIRRVYRQNNEASHVINHLLAVEDTIDGVKIEALRAKDTTQGRLLDALNTQILQDAEARAAGCAAANHSKEYSDMAVRKLRRKSDDDVGEREDEEHEEVRKPKKKTPRGWGRPANEEPDEEETEEEDGDEEDQHAEIASKLRGKKSVKRRVAEPDEEEDDEDEPPRSAFSDKVNRMRRGEEADDAEEEAEDEPEEKPKRKRAPAKTSAKRSAKPAPSDDEDTQASPPKDKYGRPTRRLDQSQIDAIASAAAAATAAAVSAAIEKILGDE